MRGDVAALGRLDGRTAPARSSLAAATEAYRARRAALLAAPGEARLDLVDRADALDAAGQRLAAAVGVAGDVAEALVLAERLAGVPTGRAVADGPAIAALEPVGVAALLAALGPADAARLAEVRPALLGSLDGAPAALRDAGNRRLLAAERAGLAARIAALEGALARHRADASERGLPLPGLPLPGLPLPGLPLPGLPPGARAGRALRTAAARAVLTVRLEARIEELRARQRAYDGWLADDDLHLLALDPVRGRVALARGDPDDADVVGVLVPGAGTTAGRLERWYGRWRDDLAADLAARRPGEATAVVLWLGYDAPSGPAAASARGRERGRQAAADLAAHVAGLRAGGAREIAVVGHSYGSVVLAEAGGALDADRLAVAGSPGLGAGTEHVDDLGLDAPLHVLTHDRDPIRVADLAVGAWAHEHGGAAADVEGVVDIDLPPGDAAGRSLLGVHAAYGAMTASRAALADVVAGRRARAPGGGHRPTEGRADGEASGRRRRRGR
ncbi:MAG: alpha/beta hydrolase [Actinomycetota bacterium]